MANIAVFKFFDEDSTSVTSSVFSNHNVGENMTLEVKDGGSADFDLTIEGKSDIQDKDSWMPIAAISLSDFSVKESVTEEGLYAFSIDGINRVRITNAGTAGGFKAFGVATAGR